MKKEITILEKENIANKIHTIRGVQVMLDRDLAELYRVETRALKQAVKRNEKILLYKIKFSGVNKVLHFLDNKKRFPSDFMFVLKDDEVNLMVSQNVIPQERKKSVRFFPILNSFFLSIYVW